MHNLITRRMYLLVPVALLLAAVIYGACTPGNDITVAESDVVITLYDQDFGFGSVKRYAMPDSIFHITGDPDDPDSPLLSRDNDDAILALIRSNFSDRGYVLVDTNAVPEPDFAVVVTAQAVENWALYSYYPWYPWYGYWWYYPPQVGASYAFTLGTLFIQMGEFGQSRPGDDQNTRTAYWLAGMNGVMDDSSANLSRRVTDSINQSFVQSPYLKTDL
jgi:hypothetical protein